MARTPKGEPPKYRRKSVSGHDYAVVAVDGRDRYLGAYGSEASLLAYAEAVAALAGGRSSRGRTLVRDVAAAFSRHAETFYAKRGRPTSGMSRAKRVARELAAMFGDVPAEEFGPVRLRRLRDIWVARGLCRRTCDSYTEAAREAFRHAVSEEMVPAAVLTALETVKGLNPARDPVHDREPVRPVPEADLEATLRELREPYRTMARLQLATGMRPGEACGIRAREVDRSGEAWVYRPGSHKTEHHGRKRVVVIGAKGREILGPWIERAASPASPLFHARPRNGVAKVVTVTGYERAVTRAAQRAGVEPWAPNRLRHNFATAVRKAHGLDAARDLLGHKKSETTEVYAEKDLERLAGLIREIG